MKEEGEKEVGCGVVRTVPGEELGDLGGEGDGLAQGLADVGHGSLAVENKAHARSQVEQHGAFVGAMRHRKVEPAGQPHSTQESKIKR